MTPAPWLAGRGRIMQQGIAPVGASQAVTAAGAGAKRSWSERTSRVRERSAMAASHAADAADSVVQYGIFRVIAIRRIA